MRTLFLAPLKFVALDPAFTSSAPTAVCRLQPEGAFLQMALCLA